MDYDALFAEQEGKCALCGEAWKPLNAKGEKARRLHRDHDRIKMQPRGLLCQYCNRQLRGSYGRKVFDADWYEKAAAYLRRYENA